MRTSSARPALAVAVLALVVSLTGVSYAAIQIPRNSVGTPHLKKNAVTSVKVRDGAIAANDLKAGTVKAALGRPGTWKGLAFASDWANSGNGNLTAAYRMDQLGRVHLRGMVTRSTGLPGSGTVIGTLPAGFRPKGDQHFPVATGPAYLPGMVLVSSDGQVSWLTGGTDEPDFTDLGSVSFWTD